MSYTKKNPPPNQWANLVAQSIHQPGTIDWLDSNIENWLRAEIHACGYWGQIDHIFPEPCPDNRWLYDEDTHSFTGYFITQYENLYGFWSHSFAYRSHFFQIFTSGNQRSYYTAGDPPQFVVDIFAKQGKEIATWDTVVSKDHPLLQKAKAECATLNPPLHKSIATKIWNKSTPDTFPAEWEARKQKHLNQH
ncbi:hypothetical protein [Leptolyngbya ohadii]|uniref:hypothetical protein n=1 Tax=Leptolyngbya ohadii TaxID=1962290 RepID=UPI000B5A07A1|nr:hypothetical protein [Leptolyngbya ohadii]